MLVGSWITHHISGGGALINARQPPWRTPNHTPGADWRARLHAKENWRAGPHANLQSVDWRAGLHAKDS
ncbi:hypothetical protein PGTUg99_009141 [Puccinia graminis f. sp. tritici]|uniref:Uncharacterized protein n=1 Tax=Puccinia graminis f. sp. tritici TaxID=56615 RepID=A0A5B0SE45_PUCGR|nr:hypothetical protein PGTUg99_009141 [Puccinia graminis f. sp. tritici]